MDVLKMHDEKLAAYATSPELLNEIIEQVPEEAKIAFFVKLAKIQSELELKKIKDIIN